MAHAHYDFMSDRRLSLISTEYSSPTQRNDPLPTPPTQWQLLHGRSSYLADTTLAQQQPSFQAYLNSFASHDSGWPAGQHHHVEPDSYRAAEISISAPSGRSRVFPVSPPNDYSEAVHPTLSHSQSNLPNILPACTYKNEPSAFQCDITPSASPASNSNLSNPPYESTKWTESLYTLDRSESPPLTPPPPSPPVVSQPVKVEQEEPAGCFIMELSAPQSQSSLLSQSMAPPMEVPLRATQAPEEMRHMMNAFRLNPFAIHGADGRTAAQPTVMEAGPLEQEPVMLEFQLELKDSMMPDGEAEVPAPNSPDHSPDYPLPSAPEDDDANRGQWVEYPTEEAPFTSTQDTSWDTNTAYRQSPEGRYTPPQDDNPAEFTSPGVTRISNSYVQRNDYEESNYTTFTASPSSLEINQIRSSHIPTSSWTRSGGLIPPSTSRSSPFMPASPGCDSANLPSMMAPSSKRWGYHEVAHTTPYLV